MNARAVGFAAMVVLVGALLVQPAAATLRWSSISYSHDHEHWATQLEPSLFGRGLVLGPGESARRTVHVTNSGGGGEHVHLTVRATGPDRHGWATTFRVDVRTGAGPWQRVRSVDGVLAADLTVDDGATVPVTVRVTSTAADHRTLNSPLHLQVELAQTERIE